MDENRFAIGIWVNPLLFSSLDAYLSKGSEIDFSKLITNLSNPDTDSSVEALKKRYEQLTKHDQGLFLVPLDDVILKKLVWPLRAAKQAFCLGNYLGCIALCGTVAEMVAIFLFELVSPQINGHEMDRKTQENLFGFSFEKLGQDRRVKVLKAYGILNRELADMADKIRVVRKRYLHILSQDFNNIETDAENAYGYCAKLVSEIVGLKTINGGGITMSPQLAKYMARADSKESSSGK